MTCNHNFKKFKKAICDNSESDVYENAMHEWVYFMVDFKDYNCICGVSIKWRFHVKNINNRKTLIIGSVCIKKFMEQNEQLIEDVDDAIEDIEKDKYNKNCKENNKLYRKCNTCRKKYKIDDLDDHDILLECFKCNPKSHDKRFNDLSKANGYLYRICNKCSCKYKLMRISDHDNLLECDICNPNLHIETFNNMCIEQDIPARRCIDCGYRYGFKDGKINTWQVRCYKCYFNRSS